MNRLEFQQLAQERIRDAEALLNTGRWSGAYYLAGYAVECALKACIAKLTNQHDFPDKERTQKSYSHKLDVLIDAAGLVSVCQAIVATNSVFSSYWSTAKDWTESARYRLWTETEARKLYEAIADPTNGVFAWIMVHW